jgi:hypothetical protein
MATVSLRNVRTGEVKTVEDQSDDLYDLKGQKIESGSRKGQPLWKEIGQGVEPAEMQASAPTTSISYANLGPDPEPHKNLTPGEVASGITSWEQKEKELEVQRRVLAGEPLPRPQRARSSAPAKPSTRTAEKKGSVKDAG